ncbi:hypothetical protein NIIDMKKI_01200 [Mycobacterium kansasii]|uniref:Uncharacterized protein n=1 Tax=Mycobacterium kansasii TaxID=1768 RepID=A0A7G1I332_MYCKA|nr:hypothetical protein NIIDMKKI_01200 [Mycobacterium kansasii]
MPGANLCLIGDRPRPGCPPANLTPVSRRAPTGTHRRFFDLDKTIIAKSSTLAFSKPFFAQGLLNRRAVLKSSYAQFIFLLSGADHDQMDRMRVHMTNMCTGWDVEQVKSIVNETLHDIVTPWSSPKPPTSSPPTSCAAVTSWWSPPRVRRSWRRSPARWVPLTRWPPGWWW